MSDLKLVFHFPVSSDVMVQVRSTYGNMTDDEIDRLIDVLLMSKGNSKIETNYNRRKTGDEKNKS